MTTPRKKYSPTFKSQRVQEVLEGNKTVTQIASEYGIHPNMLTKWKQLALKGLPQSFDERTQKQIALLTAQYEQEKEQLYAEIGRLTTPLRWLGKKVKQALPRSVRLSLIETQKAELSLSKQSELLGISRSSLYYRSVAPTEREIELKHRIDEIYTVYPFYGYRRIHQQLLREGKHLNRKTVQNYMREMGLEAIYPGPNLSKRDQKQRVYPYLLRNLAITRPAQVFGTDITYIKLKHGWLYLVAVIDWYSRYVVSWELSDTLEIDFVLRTTERALAKIKPEIFNSDQGSHFTSPKYTALILGAGVKLSMDGRGRALDNVFTERLWRSLKYECVYLAQFENPKEAKLGIGEYFDFYNNTRPHQALKYQTPAQVYFNTVTPVIMLKS
ncbi:IS3 family transposase (plasmid) [Candidatus Chlorohelix allophototropha]|uniref:IS3 family transposase n=1 Tax=Candidatus Chlorohelix allophototropha TaxID=3003348 RepID=A0ABY9AYB2_9CHLR|nr:IS3 family transposase [Chloroflexota bacterium L227-S17]WJW70218.1 IS3 family transposase [Chloroflexota bacterium L227-S17]